MGFFDDMGAAIGTIGATVAGGPIAGAIVGGATGAIDFGGLWDDITGVSAAQEAAAAQTAGSQAAIDTQMQMFNQQQALLDPYVQAGYNSMDQMQALSGALGPEAQQAAYDSIQASPGFQSALQAGETSILQNAAATGGLRGGNTQAALAQFSPQLLASAIDQRYSQLGGLTQLGQASAAGVGSAGMQAGANIGGLQSQMGNTAAQAALAQYQMPYNFLTDLTGLAIQGAGAASGGGF